jgi:predicted transcriptional regulator
MIDKLFHGSPEQLLAHLVEDRTLTADDLQRLRKRLASEPRPRPRRKR